MKFGRFEIHSFVEKRFRLDGGQMFGVVPKMLWSRLITADDNNLIDMVTNVYLLKAHGKTILFETGLGDTLTEKEQKVYGTDGSSALESGLSSLGVTPADIDMVILTHLHTDHAGGAVKRDGDRYVPRFPNARYIAPAEEWEIAAHPNERTAAVYVPERLHPLEEAGQLELIGRDEQLMDGIRTIHTGGHTEGHFALEMSSEGQTILYYADIFPTRHHMRVPYVAATDIFPLDTMAAKRIALERLTDDNTVICFDHDVDVVFGRVMRDGRRITVEPVRSEVLTT